MAVCPEEEPNSRDGSPVPAEACSKEKIVGAKEVAHGSLAKSSLGSLARLVLLDLPLVAVLCLIVGSQLLDYVAPTYLHKQMNLQRWDQRKRGVKELTYYSRGCTVKDQTAFDQEDLLIKDSMTLEDKKNHMLLHGASVYPNLFTEETMNNVRDFILAQNMKNEDMIGIIENENRWSFGIRVDQHPSVTRALEELLNNPVLVEALEGIMGPDPAIIEFTGITSGYGAATQRWHQDVVPEGSAAKYGNTFIPSYSLFIPLQNTSKALGATDICPGTHMCSTTDFCEQTGFPVSGKVDNWPAGWGALLNQQMAHRGPAHQLKGGPNRVLFILTFAPRPRYEWSETRQISTGGSYSLHWSQWGHTMRDFANPLQRMRKPLRYLKTMGIYKSASSNWGWDYLSQSSARTANGEEGWADDNFFDYVTGRGGWQWLPTYLHGKVNVDESNQLWVDYIVDTYRRLRAVLQKTYVSVLGMYAIAILTGVVRSKSTGHAVSAIVRLSAMHLIAYAILKSAVRHVDQSRWARDISAARLYNIPPPVANAASDFPSTLPNDLDILALSEEYAMNSLSSYSRILEVKHPGNLAWNSIIRQKARGYHLLSPILRALLRKNVIEWVHADRRRVLAKNSGNAWGVATADYEDEFCHESLMQSDVPVVGHVITQLEHLSSLTRFGRLRDTSLQKKHTESLLKDMRIRIIGKRQPHLGKHTHKASLDILSWIKSRPRLSMSFRTLSSFPPRPESIEEPYPGAWRKGGDLVEAWYQGSSPEIYVGRVVGVNADFNTWDVEYVDGEEDFGLCHDCLWPFRSYNVGEDVEVRVAEDEFASATVAAVHSFDVCELRLTDTGEHLERVSFKDIRRFDSAKELILAAGTRVHAAFEGGGEFFPGTIRAVYEDGEFFDIFYDDGDFESNVARRFVKNLN